MLITGQDAFNLNFMDYLKSTDSKLSLFEKLLQFSLENGYLDKDSVVDISSRYKKVLIQKVLLQDTEEDLFNLELIRKARLDKMVLDFNDELMEHKPYDNINEFVNGNLENYVEKLLLDSKLHRNNVVNSIKEARKCSEYLFSSNPFIRDFLDNMVKYVTNRGDFVAVYSLMGCGYSIDKNPSIRQVQIMLDMYVTELNILNKFGKDYINDLLKKLSSGSKDEVNINIYNVCEKVLMVYLYSSCYLEDYEKLSFSEEMVKSMLFESSINGFDNNEFLDVLNNGKIKFNDDEIQYINSCLLAKLNVNDMGNVLGVLLENKFGV